jgi:hypothetical protein
MKNNICCSRFQIFTVVIVGLIYSFAAQASLIINGGFEEPVFVDNPLHYVKLHGTELTGWNSFSTYSGTVLFNPSYDLVSEGMQAVQIEYSGDYISQSFATNIGQSYWLSFDLSAYTYSSGMSAINVTVGPAFATYTGSAGSYVQHTLSFTADSSLTTLVFENAGGGYYYPQLDNVSVNTVPIPAAFWLFGSGLVGLIGAARCMKAQSR